MSALAAYAPWTDKKGRLHPLRAAVFALLLAPGALLAFNWLTVGLGARPVNVAIHSTGYWSVWILLASLLISPLKALTAEHVGAPPSELLAHLDEALDGFRQGPRADDSAALALRPCPED